MTFLSMNWPLCIFIWSSTKSSPRLGTEMDDFDKDPHILPSKQAFPKEMELSLGMTYPLRTIVIKAELEFHLFLGRIHSRA